MDGESRYLNGARAFWRLDEDPSAQGFDKAGFWIWGLFEEPKYPFMLLQLELSQPIPLAIGEVPAGIIYGQVPFRFPRAFLWACGAGKARDERAAGAGDAGQGAGGVALRRRRDPPGERADTAAFKAMERGGRGRGLMGVRFGSRAGAGRCGRAGTNERSECPAIGLSLPTVIARLNGYTLCHAAKCVFLFAAASVGGRSGLMSGIPQQAMACPREKSPRAERPGVAVRGDHDSDGLTFPGFSYRNRCPVPSAALNQRRPPPPPPPLCRARVRYSALCVCEEEWASPIY